MWLIQVLAFQKSWRSFSSFTVCIVAQCQCRNQGGGVAGGEEAVSFLKNRALYDTAKIYGNGLGWFGGGLGWFGVVWSVSSQVKTKFYYGPQTPKTQV